MSRESMIEAHNIVATLRAHGEFVAQSVTALRGLQAAIQLLAQTAGFRLVFEPGTDPDLMDYLAIVGVRTVEGAIIGGLAGLVVGALADRPAQGATIGAGLGAVVGVAQGIDAVNRGFRVRASYLPDGALHVRQF